MSPRLASGTTRLGLGTSSLVLWSPSLRLGGAGLGLGTPSLASQDALETGSVLRGDAFYLGLIHIRLVGLVLFKCSRCFLEHVAADASVLCRPRSSKVVPGRPHHPRSSLVISSSKVVPGNPRGRPRSSQAIQGVVQGLPRASKRSSKIVPGPPRRRPKHIRHAQMNT